MKIDAIGASWDRVKVSLAAGPRWQTLQQDFEPRPPKIDEIPGHPLRINEITAGWDRVKVCLGARLRPDSAQQDFWPWTPIRGRP